jgi:hypothetical protein
VGREFASSGPFPEPVKLSEEGDNTHTVGAPRLGSSGMRSDDPDVLVPEDRIDALLILVHRRKLSDPWV